MADKADGSIIIDTKLDSKGFNAGSKELLNAIRSLTGEIKSLGETLNSILSQRISPNVDTSAAENQLEELESKTQSVQNDLGNLKINSPVEGNSALPDVSNTTNQVNDLQKQINSVNTSVERLEPSFQKAMSGSENAMTAFESKASELETKISQLQERLEAVGNTQYPTQEYEEVCDEIEKVKQKLDSLNDKRQKYLSTGGKFNTSQWRSLNYDMMLVENRYQSLLENKKQFENSGTAFVQGIDTAQYQQMAAALTAAEQKLREMTADAAQFRSESAQAGSYWAQMPTLSGAIKSSFQQIGARLQTVGTGLQHPLQAADRVLGSMLQKTKSFAKTAVSAAKNIAGKLVSSIKAAASHMRQLLTHGKSMKGQFAGLISSAKKFALSMLGARGVYALLRKAVSAYMAENEELTNTLNACWSGIGNLLGPIITRLVNLVAKAVAYTTSFLKLFGVFCSSASKAISSTGKTAEKQTKELKRQLASFDELNVLSDNSKDSGDSGANASLPEVELPDWAKEIANLLKAGQWADAATKLAEKLNALIASIDWAAAGDKIGYYLDGILTFLTTFIKAFDWRSLGGDLATMLNHVIKSVDWKNLGGLLVSGLYIAFESLIGFFDKFDGAAFGRALYDIISGAIDFCDWVKISGELSRKFSDFIQSIDFEKLANVLSRGARTALQSLNAIITEFDWHGLGVKIANFFNGIDWAGWANDAATLIGNAFKKPLEMINGFVENVNFKEAAEGLSAGIRTLLQSLTTGVKEFKWQDLGKKIAEFINGIDWPGIIGDLVSFVSETLKGALGLIVGFIENIDWAKLGHDVFTSLVNIISNIDWSGIVSLAFELLGAAIAGIISYTATYWMDVWEALKAGYEATKEYFAKFIEEAGGNIIEGLWNGIINALKNVGNWIIENIWNPFIKGFKEAFDIHSPSKKMEEMGDYIIEGLWNGIKQSWQNITEFFRTALSAVSQTISNAWSAVKSFTSTTWNSIKSGLSTAWSGLKSSATQHFNNMKTAISNSWNALKTTAASAWNNIKNTILNQGWSGVGTNICNGIKSGLEAGWTWLKNTVSGLATNLLNAAKSALGIASPSKLFRDEVGLFIGYGVGEGIEKAEPTILKSVTSVADAIADEMNAGEYTISEIVPATEVNGALTDFADRITDGFSSMLDRMQAIAESVTFTMPIAAGGIVPYKTAAAVGRDDPENVGAVIEASNDAMADLIVQAVTSATVSIVDAIRDYSGGNDSFDSNKITDAVIQEINKRTRINNQSPILI